MYIYIIKQLQLDNWFAYSIMYSAGVTGATPPCSPAPVPPNVWCVEAPVLHRLRARGKRLLGCSCFSRARDTRAVIVVVVVVTCKISVGLANQRAPWKIIPGPYAFCPLKVIDRNNSDEIMEYSTLQAATRKWPTSGFEEILPAEYHSGKLLEFPSEQTPLPLSGRINLQ